MKTRQRKIHIDLEEFEKFFTSNMVKRIKNKDGEAINLAFEKFRDFFEGIAMQCFAQCANKPFYEDFTEYDFVSQIYLDMPYYRFDKPSYLWNSVKFMLPYIRRGGYAYMREEYKKAFNSKYNTPEMVPLFFKPFFSESSDDDEINALDFLGCSTKSLEDEFFCEYEKKQSIKLITPLLNYCRSLYSGRSLKAFDLYMEGCNLSAWHMQFDKSLLIKNYPIIRKILNEIGLFKPEYDEYYFDFMFSPKNINLLKTMVLQI